ncbi:MAG: hypothetical protein AAGH78_16195 [Cyanobacteria bacterium P01_H01_bin.58]
MQEKQKATKVTLYLPPELHRQLKIRSAVDGEAMSALAERALKFYLSHSEVVEAFSEHGDAHRVYSCPTCSESVVLQEGDLVSVKDAVASSRSDGLDIDMQDMVGGSGLPESSRLVTC